MKLESENCSFITNGEFEHGFCTYYGACRIKMNDYMYQGAMMTTGLRLYMWTVYWIQSEQYKEEKLASIYINPFCWVVRLVRSLSTL